jgi:hypothetical protein
MNQLVYNALHQKLIDCQRYNSILDISNIQSGFIFSEYLLTEF